jgi:hypothetical protein
VWAAVRAVGGLERWFPIIATCTVTGSGVGAVRVLGLAEGGELRDTVEEVADGARRLRYRRTVHPFPCSEYVGTVTVEPAGPARCDLTWTIETDVAPDRREELGAFVHAAISDGLAGLARELEGEPA